MKILRFPVHCDPGRDVAFRLALVERLLRQCLSRQSSLQEDGRRLRDSLERLQVLTRKLARGTAILRRSAGRLRSSQPRVGSPVSPT